MKHPPSNKTRGFTLIEILVVVAIIGFLAALSIPAINATMKRAQNVKSINNLRQISTLSALYTADNDGTFLPGKFRKDSDGSFHQWQVALAEYITKQQIDGIWNLPNFSTTPLRMKSEFAILASPSFKLDPNAFWETGYGINMSIGLPEDTRPNTAESWGRMYRTSEVTALSKRPLIFEWPIWNAHSSFTSADYAKALEPYGQINILFCDGHVGSVKKADEATFKKMIENPNSI